MLQFLSGILCHPVKGMKGRGRPSEKEEIQRDSQGGRRGKEGDSCPLSLPVSYKKGTRKTRQRAPHGEKIKNVSLFSRDLTPLFLKKGERSSLSFFRRKRRKRNKKGGLVCAPFLLWGCPLLSARLALLAVAPSFPLSTPFSTRRRLSSFACSPLQESPSYSSTADVGD